MNHVFFCRTWTVGCACTGYWEHMAQRCTVGQGSRGGKTGKMVRGLLGNLESNDLCRSYFDTRLSIIADRIDLVE